jgi:hypothetical protein
MNTIRPETILEFITMLGAFIGFYAKMQSDNREKEIRIGYLEGMVKKLFDKMDEIGENITGIRIEMERKSDRH